jgi:NADPH:quinone reductase-like Zn-dependent oxidoreductase
MEAIILKDFGDADNLVKAEISIPKPTDNEVLVQVKAIGINPVDVKTRKGKSLARDLKDFDPIILGWDISGIVTDTGKTVTSFKKGDDVFGMVNFPGHGKAYAEYVTAPESHLALKPSNISHTEAAGACLAALTAWQILKRHIKHGDRILIHSAAGGVGHYAVQMAKHLGAWVSGTSSGKNREFVLNLGVSQHIDYENTRFEDVLKDLDFVLDAMGGDYIDRSLKVLKEGGKIVCMPTALAEDVAEKATREGKKGLTFLVNSNGDDMNEIAYLMERKIIKSYISQTFSFDQIQDAHIQIESGKTKGKIVMVPWNGAGGV